MVLLYEGFRRQFALGNQPRSGCSNGLFGLAINLNVYCFYRRRGGGKKENRQIQRGCGGKHEG